MIDFLEEIDRSIVVAINSWNNPFLDELMWIVSDKLTWIPFYLLILYLFFKNEGLKKMGIFLIGAIVAVAVADLSSVHLFKDVFQRYRPSHNLLIENILHYHQFEDGKFYQGGLYGFVSSHAANFLAICTFSYLMLRNYYKKLIYILAFVVVLVCYSRLYLGVHYLSDVFVGGIVGIIAALLSYKFVYLPLSERITTEK